MKPILLFLFGLLLFFEQPLFAEENRLSGESSYNAGPLLQNNVDSMYKPPRVLIQYILPQHYFSRFAGWLAESRLPWVKNNLIRYYLYRFKVDMRESIIENPLDYPSFNSFFTRALKPECRPIVEDPDAIASPVDGFVSQIGKIKKETLIQAKGRRFKLTDLLGGSNKLASLFAEGNFATFYLSPKDYHRVHMPIDGALCETLFIPGKLFSVDQQTTQNVPNLFAKNERLVCIFDTKLGPMAVILVGAMIVGSIETTWYTDTSAGTLKKEFYAGSIKITRGKEIGYFKMGSTVIVLFGKDKIHWKASLGENSVVRMGEKIGEQLKR